MIINFSLIMRIVILFITVLASGSLFAQQACDTPEGHQFDFWVGEWDVYGPADTIVGYNTIKKIQGGCILQENWRSGSSAYTGTSYNFYNQQTRKWNQVWIDNQGAHLYLSGAYENGKMVLKGSGKLSQTGNKYFDRISWYNNPDGTVRQLWEAVGEDGQILNVLFDGIYKRKKR